MFGVAALGDVAALHGPHAGLDVDLSGQALRRVLVLVDVGQEALGIQKDGVAARGRDDGHAGVQEHLTEGCGLPHPGADVAVVEHLLDAHGDGCQIRQSPGRRR